MQYYDFIKHCVIECPYCLKLITYDKLSIKNAAINPQIGMQNKFSKHLNNNPMCKAAHNSMASNLTCKGVFNAH